MDQRLRPEYARLELAQEITTASGGKSRELVFHRATCKDMTEVLDIVRGSERLERFVSSCCRALNGKGEETFSFRELDAADAAEVSSVMNTMWREGQEIDSTPNEGEPGYLSDGDAISTPIVYTLRHEVQLNPAAEGAPVLKQIEFQARRVGQISEYLDSRGEGKEFTSFMRAFAQPMGTRLPLTDAVINALDYEDYGLIRRKILGKLAMSRGRWRKTSTG